MLLYEYYNYKKINENLNKINYNFMTFVGFFFLGLLLLVKINGRHVQAENQKHHSAIKFRIKIK